MLSPSELKRLREMAEVLVVALGTRDFTVEIRDSVKANRIYLGASRHDPDEHYIIQIDVT